jgi:hypothetical protein
MFSSYHGHETAVWRAHSLLILSHTGGQTMRHIQIGPRTRRALTALALLGLGALDGCVAYPADPGYGYYGGYGGAGYYGGPAYYGYAPGYVAIGGGCCWGGGWHGGGGGWHGGGGGWNH